MLKVGLTGGIGSGKSTVSKYIKELGFEIIDADIISREVLVIYPEILENIRKQFGEEFFDENSQLDRRKFGNYLFRNKSKLAEYEKIILPLIKREIFNRMEQLERRSEKVCFLDAATLIEKGIYKQMDKNILIWVERDIQIKRVANRDNMALDDVNERINSQMSLDKKREYVDFVVNNSKEIEETKKEVNNILKELGIIKREVHLS